MIHSKPVDIESTARDYSRLEKTVFSRSRVSSLSVLVVGAGALGNEAIKNLALLGVGNLYIVDPDILERSNLTRSILFCASDIEEHLQNSDVRAVVAHVPGHVVGVGRRD